MLEDGHHVAQDHYENLYAVITGVKTFSLLPPSDAYRLSIRRYPVAQYEHGSTTRLQLRLKEPKEARPGSASPEAKPFMARTILSQAIEYGVALMSAANLFSQQWVTKVCCNSAQLWMAL